MAACRNCQRSGWFLSITSDGVCHDCQNGISLEVANRVRIIKESEEIIGRSKNLNTKVSRAECIIQQIEALSRYEDKGIPTVKPTPSALLKQWQQQRDAIILDDINAVLNEANAKAASSKSDKVKHGAFLRVFSKIMTFRNNLTDPTGLDQVQNEVLRTTLELEERIDNLGSKPVTKASAAPDNTDLSGLNKELVEHSQKGHWALYSATMFRLGNQLRNTGQREEALERYLEACYLNLNGPKNYGIIDDPDLLKQYPSFDPKDGFLPSGVLAEVENAIAALGLTANETKTLFDKVAARLHARLRLPLGCEDAWAKLEAEIFPKETSD